MKDTVVSGSLRATDTIYSITNQFQTLKIPTTSNGTTYGAGTSGQILKTNGTSVYWASDAQGVTSITPGNGLLNGTGTSAITDSGTLNLSYGATTQSIGTASGGSANTVSRSDHVHTISLATGDNNGQVKIAGTNVNVKGLEALAYKASLVESDIPTISITSKTSGTLTVGRGGTGTTTAPTQGGIIYASSNSAYASTATGITGQFLKSNNTNAPTWVDITQSDIKPLLSETNTYNSSYNRHFFISLTKTTLDTATIHFKITLLKNTSDKYNIIKGEVLIFSPTIYSYNLTQSVSDFNTFYIGNATGTNQYHLGIGNIDQLITGYNQIKIEILSCTNCTPAIAYSNLSDNISRTFSSYLIQLGSNTNNLTVANDLTIKNDLEVTNNLTVKGETMFYNNISIPQGSLFYNITINKVISVSYHGHSTGNITFNVPQGYFPLSIRAWTLSGTNSFWAHVYKINVRNFNEQNLTAEINYGLFSHNSSTISPSLNVSVLCYRYTPGTPAVNENEIEGDD